MPNTSSLPRMTCAGHQGGSRTDQSLPSPPPPSAAHAQTLCQKHLRLADHGPRRYRRHALGCPPPTPPPASPRWPPPATPCCAFRPTPPSTTPCSPPCPPLPSCSARPSRAGVTLEKPLRRRRPPLAIDLHLIAYHGLPGEALPQPGQERHLFLPCLRHRLRHPPELRFTVALDLGATRRGRLPGRDPASAGAAAKAWGAAALPLAGPGLLQGVAVFRYLLEPAARAF